MGPSPGQSLVDWWHQQQGTMREQEQEMAQPQGMTAGTARAEIAAIRRRMAQSQQEQPRAQALRGQSLPQTAVMSQGPTPTMARPQGPNPVMGEINAIRRRMAQRREGFVNWWHQAQPRQPVTIGPGSNLDFRGIRPPRAAPIPTSSEIASDRGEALRDARGRIQQDAIDRGLFGASRQRVVEKRVAEKIGEKFDEKQRKAIVARYERWMKRIGPARPQQVQPDRRVPARLRGLL